MSRLAKKAEQEQNRRARSRPYVIGVGVVAVLLVGMFVSDAWRTEPVTPNLEITAGRIHVEGVDALVDVLPGEAVPSPQKETVPDTQVRFYELLGTDQIAGQPESLVMRELPLPPPPGEEPELFPVPKPPEPAPSTQPAQAPTQAAPVAKDDGSVPDAVVVAKKSDGDSTAHEAKVAPPETRPGGSVQNDTNSVDAPAVNDDQMAPEPTESLPYTLQVASFSQSARAEELMARLEKAGHSTYLVPVDLGVKGLWWRVRVGHYASEAAAKWARLDLVKLGVSPIVIRADDTP